MTIETQHNLVQIFKIFSFCRCEICIKYDFMEMTGFCEEPRYATGKLLGMIMDDNPKEKRKEGKSPTRKKKKEYRQRSISSSHSRSEPAEAEETKIEDKRPGKLFNLLILDDDDYEQLQEPEKEDQKASRKKNKKERRPKSAVDHNNCHSKNEPAAEETKIEDKRPGKLFNLLILDDDEQSPEIDKEDQKALRKKSKKERRQRSASSLRKSAFDHDCQNVATPHSE